VTIDERLEALTQSVELMAPLHRDNEQRVAQLVDSMNRNEQRVGQVMDTMNRMGRIIEIHDADLDNLNHRLDKLEHPSQ
jgi:ABC-type transporter Mla subunit MlaD